MNDWLIKNFKVDPSYATFIEFFIAILVVLALLAVFVWVLRRVTGSRFTGGRNRQPRLSIMDATAIDQRRRIILIRRDNVEHLILVGGPTDVVVEQNIVRGVPVSASYPRPGGTAEPVTEQKPPAMAMPPIAPANLQTPPMPASKSAAAAPRPATPQPAPAQRPRPAAPQGEAPAVPQGGHPQTAAQRPRQTPPSTPASAQGQPASQQPAARQAPAEDQLQRRAGAAVAAAGAAVANLARETIAKVPTPARTPMPERQPEKPQEPMPRRTITPPSSGPAANAKSLYLQPQDSEAKTETAPAVQPAAAQMPAGRPTGPIASPKSEAAPTSERTAVTSQIFSLADSLEEDLLGGLSTRPGEPSTNKPAPVTTAMQSAAAAGSTVSRLAPADVPATERAPQEVMPVSPPVSATTQSIDSSITDKQISQPRPGPVAPAFEAPSKASAETGSVQAARQEGEASALAPRIASGPGETDRNASGLTAEAPAVDTGAFPGKNTKAPPEIKPAPQAAPITIDAIEEEMAKLLNEIGGNRSK